MKIRALFLLDELAEVTELFGRVWAAPAREAVSVEVLRAMTTHGSLLLGAFDGSSLAGAVFGSWGRDADGMPWMYSSKLGVDVSYRGSGLAERLKRAQAAWASERGVEELRWTFDPMRALNAAFNVAKLRAVGIAFYEDLQGARTDMFNAGQRTDRMMVSWRASSPATETEGDVRLVQIKDRDQLRDDLRAAFDDGFRAVGFRRPGTYVMAR